MARLIDADAFKKRFRNGTADTEAEKLMNATVRRMIDEQPTVDAVEVVHGVWLPYEHKSGIPVEFDEDDNWITHTYILNQCSICGRTEREKQPYCHCGAKMDGDKD